MSVRLLWKETNTALPALIATLAPWVYDASNPFADWYFGDPDAAAEILTEWMARPDSELYLGRALLLSDAAGKPEGAIVWVRGAQLSGCRAADFAAFLGDLGGGSEADAIALEVTAGARALFPAVDPGDAYISRVAVDRARRGLGMGKRLLQATLAALRDEGFSRVRLDVSDDNAAAIALYESAGFATQSTSPHDESGLCYRAMVLSL